MSEVGSEAGSAAGSLAADEERLVWLLHDGKAGHRAQGLGLIAALGTPSREAAIALRPPWRWSFPSLPFVPASGIEGLDAAPVARAIVVGRAAIAAGLVLKARGARVVALQNPRVAPGRFDLVIAPAHDRLREAAVIATQGALHPLTPAVLAAARTAWAPAFAAMPRPWIALLVGGASRHHIFAPEDAALLGGEVAALARRLGGSVLGTVSRRTGRDQARALVAALAAVPHRLWTGEEDGPNPYRGLLALADLIVATDDSVSMLSEAVATGTGVLAWPMPGRGSPRLARLKEDFVAAGYVRPFSLAAGEPWRFTAPDDRARVVQPALAALGLASPSP